MALLSIPAPLAPETIMVLEAVARLLSQRQAAGCRVENPDPTILSAAIAETIGVTRGGTFAIGYWIATENATYGRLLELAASVIEQADAIARSVELKVKPMAGMKRPPKTFPSPKPVGEGRPASAVGGRGRGLSADQAPHDLVTLPCDCEPAIDTAARDALAEIEADDLREIEAAE